MHSGRLHILGEMKRCIDSPRKLKDSIPKITEFKILPDALGKVIGPKGYQPVTYVRTYMHLLFILRSFREPTLIGKTVQTLIDTYGVKNINLEDDGSIQIESFSAEQNDLVKAAILKIVVRISSTYIHTYIHTYIDLSIVSCFFIYVDTFMTT